MKSNDCTHLCCGDNRYLWTHRDLLSFTEFFKDRAGLASHYGRKKWPDYASGNMLQMHRLRQIYIQQKYRQNYSFNAVIIIDLPNNPNWLRAIGMDIMLHLTLFSFQGFTQSLAAEVYSADAALYCYVENIIKGGLTVDSCTGSSHLFLAISSRWTNSVIQILPPFGN